MQGKCEELTCISLHFLWRIGTFQWVTSELGRNFSLKALPPLFPNLRLSFACMISIPRFAKGITISDFLQEIVGSYRVGCWQRHNFRFSINSWASPGRALRDRRPTAFDPERPFVQLKVARRRQGVIRELDGGRRKWRIAAGRSERVRRHSPP